MGVGNYRAPFVNYRKKGIFMITCNKNKKAPFFSSLYQTGLDDKYKGINVKFSPIGDIIFNHIKNINKRYPKLSIDQFVIMPDHIHFILRILDDLEEHLDFYIAKFQDSISSTCYLRNLISEPMEIFNIGYNDQFLLHSRSLQSMYVYIWENPYSLYIRKEHPEFFRREEKGEIFGIPCQLYGNLQLLKNPFIYPVVIHRRDSAEQRRIKKQKWLYAIKNGGVIAGAFYSEEEKKVRDYAIENGGKIILFSNDRYGEKEKPGGKYRDICVQGRFLRITPEFPANIIIRRDCYDKAKLSKEQSRYLNSIIEKFPL